MPRQKGKPKEKPGPKGWTTPDERVYLNLTLPKFLEAQHKKTTSSFFQRAYLEWFEKFPLSPSDAEDGEAVQKCRDVRSSRSLPCGAYIFI
jgi:hypothetical protein